MQNQKKLYFEKKYYNCLPVLYFIIFAVIVFSDHHGFVILEQALRIFWKSPLNVYHNFKITLINNLAVFDK